MYRNRCRDVRGRASRLGVTFKVRGDPWERCLSLTLTLTLTIEGERRHVGTLNYQSINFGGNTGMRGMRGMRGRRGMRGIRGMRGMRGTKYAGCEVGGG